MKKPPRELRVSPRLALAVLLCVLVDCRRKGDVQLERAVGGS